METIAHDINKTFLYVITNKYVGMTVEYNSLMDFNTMNSTILIVEYLYNMFCYLR